VLITAQDMDAEITATILLQKQNAYGRYVSVESWKETEIGSLSFCDTYTNAQPGNYRLKVDIDATGSSGSDSFSINETAILPVSN